PLLNVSKSTAGRYDFDTMTVIRTRGNLDQVIGPARSVIPERSYQWTVPYRVDPGVSSGRAQLRVVFFGVGRPEIYVDGPDLRGGQPAMPLQRSTFGFTPPSGYDAVELRLFSEDIVGGAIWVGQGQCADTD